MIKDIEKLKSILKKGKVEKVWFKRNGEWSLNITGNQTFRADFLVKIDNERSVKRMIAGIEKKLLSNMKEEKKEEKKEETKHEQPTENSTENLEKSLKAITLELKRRKSNQKGANNE